MSKFKKLFIFFLFCNFILGATHLNAILSHITVYQNQKGKKVILFGECHDTLGTNSNRTRDIRMVTQLIQEIEEHSFRTVGIVAELNKKTSWLDSLVYDFRKDKSLLETIYGLPLRKIKLKTADLRTNQTKTYLTIGQRIPVNESMVTKGSLIGALRGARLQNWETFVFEKIISNIEDALKTINQKTQKLQYPQTLNLINQDYTKKITYEKQLLETELITFNQTLSFSHIEDFDVDTYRTLHKRLLSVSILIADMGFLYSIMKALQKLDTVIFIGGFFHTRNLATELTKLGFEQILNEEIQIPTESIIEGFVSIDKIMQDCFVRFPDDKLEWIFRNIRSIAFPDLPPEEHDRDDENTTPCNNDDLLLNAVSTVY